MGPLFKLFKWAAVLLVVGLVGPYMLERIEKGIPGRVAGARKAAAAPAPR
jgi:hypothetical protein